ncbi:MAG: cell division protein FtsZ [Candidatus Zambryskibacteria bacterium CG10_big_fil_rev_8_21_14_0_10_42_12]|uniref:Cell division protein FtsZ n=1 Tax=Candidatus Zambryskibacteria bacterium CG10_big_fil_rev_8_21_14_0_10_42_12 TaxID=1975115 RepID=A0A2H0QVB6_9BACT|nr:MAG: cell division protein FtsZ [Candidatus Zambryskibacteria bacterium CG10_big_fil_rev_8_21_14_0_10_42_12]
MPQIKPDVETFARIKVLGVGGSGKNAVNHMVNSKVKGVEFIVVNTDAQDLHNSFAKKKIHIGKNLTRGLGTGMNPDMGKRAAEETKEEIQETIKGADMVFIASGLGGGTGTGAAPVVAKTAHELDALTVAVVTKPFSFEGTQRMRLAEKGLEELSKSVDAIIVIPNDRLLATIDKDTSARNAFAMCDDVLKSAVEGISDLITTPGIINIDFADIRAVMANAGPALMGIGKASGEKRAEEAARNAINSPLLELSVNGARGVLFSIAGGEDLTMFEIQDAARVITESADPEAKIIFGTVRDDKLKKGEVKVTVIATGFPETALKKTLFHESKPATPVVRPQQQEVTDSEEPRGIGRIFNTVSQPRTEAPQQQPQRPAEPKPQPKQPEPQPVDEEDEDDDDDWGAVPAFLRRSKLK